MPGGTVRYSASALKSLGLNVGAFTRVASDDDPLLLRDLREAGVHVRALPSETSTVFENSYEGPELAVRKQRVGGIAAPFHPDDVLGVRARIIQLGPLTSGEMSPAFIDAVAATGAKVGLDIQGYTRQIIAGAVHQVRAEGLSALLRNVAFIKADDNEARVVTGETDVNEAARHLQRLTDGAEILITFADRGSLVLDAEGVFHRVPAFPPAGGRVIDATGCGDTYFAGYLYRRLGGGGPKDAGRFAAALSSLKLEDYGPFAGRADDAHARAASDL
jgi:sugar/nucleoside kinase (ribokinase family)